MSSQTADVRERLPQGPLSPSGLRPERPRRRSWVRRPGRGRGPLAAVRPGHRARPRRRGLLQRRRRAAAGWSGCPTPTTSRFLEPGTHWNARTCPRSPPRSERSCDDTAPATDTGTDDEGSGTGDDGGADVSAETLRESLEQSGIDVASLTVEDGTATVELTPGSSEDNVNIVCPATEPFVDRVVVVLDGTEQEC